MESVKSAFDIIGWALSLLVIFIVLAIVFGILNAMYSSVKDLGRGQRDKKDFISEEDVDGCLGGLFEIFMLFGWLVFIPVGFALNNTLGGIFLIFGVGSFAVFCLLISSG